jgi:hypothetical protein
MPKLGSKEDVSKSRKAADGGGSSDDYIKLEKSGITYVTLLKSDYTEAYEHWVPNADPKKPKTHTNCGGGVDGNGWAPDHCPICAEAAAKFEAKKAAKDENDEKLAAQLNGEGLDLRANYRAFFHAAKGSAIVERKNGKKIETFDFEDFDGKPRILALSAAQFKLLIKLVEGGEHGIESGDDLVGKVLAFTKKDKQSRDGKKTYGEVVSIEPVGEIELEISDKAKYPNIEQPYNAKDAEKAIALYKGEAVSEDYGADSDAKVNVKSAIAKAKAHKAAKKGK